MPLRRILHERRSRYPLTRLVIVPVRSTPTRSRTAINEGETSVAAQGVTNGQKAEKPRCSFNGEYGSTRTSKAEDVEALPRPELIELAQRASKAEQEAAGLRRTLRWTETMRDSEQEKLVALRTEKSESSGADSPMEQ
eukprot:5414779-Prymnesium_polylepis.2